MVVYSLAIDALLFTTVPSIGRFLPGQAGKALSGAWTAALIVGAAVRGDRSDI